MHYCGVVPMQGALQLAMLEEVRAPEPPIRLSAVFFEPGSAAQVAAELSALPEVVLGAGAPLGEPNAGRPARDCDALLLRRGVGPQAPDPETRRLGELLSEFVAYEPDDDRREGAVADGAGATDIGTPGGGPFRRGLPRGNNHALGHASWLGEPEEAVIVLPGSSLPSEFAREGVLPPVERLHLPAVPD